MLKKPTEVSIENKTQDSNDCICTEPGFCPVLKEYVGEFKLQKCQESEFFRNCMRGKPRPEQPKDVPKLTRSQRLRQAIRKQPGFVVRDSLGQTCQHLGDVKHQEPCSCGSHTTIAIHECGHSEVNIGCVPHGNQHQKIRDEEARRAVTCCESCQHRQQTPRFISQRQLDLDLKTLIAKLPPNITRIAGVARSGLPVAGTIANSLHLPIDIIRQSKKDVMSAGHGWRLQGAAQDDSGIVLVVDDTCMTGNTLKDIQPFVEAHYKGLEVRYASIYVNPLADRKPDLWSVDLPHPHLLEWNLFNSMLTTGCAFDMDGILCHDCPAPDDDDGPRYARFLENVPPLYVARKGPIPLIVTARLEKYRAETEAWLEKWGIETRQLVMGPWENLEERSRADIAAFKAEHYRRFRKKRVRPGPHLFIESDPRQARRIAELSQGIVVCPAAERCYP